jgi:hypothetical protein
VETLLGREDPSLEGEVRACLLRWHTNLRRVIGIAPPTRTCHPHQATQASAFHEEIQVRVWARGGVLPWPRHLYGRGGHGQLERAHGGGLAGLVGYYRCFINDYSMIAALLTALLRKTGFRWTEVAFRVLQHVLTMTSVLQLPNFGRDFIVECDVSKSSFGIALHQGGAPIAFFSKHRATQSWRHMSVSSLVWSSPSAIGGTTYGADHF